MTDRDVELRLPGRSATTVGDPSSRLKPDRKSPPQSETSPVSSNNEPASSKKIAEVACLSCRKRKGKCTGERPSCAACARRGVECQYEFEEGLTRVGPLRLKLDSATAKAETLQFIFDQLRTRSDNEAACLLAIIRLGADVQLVADKLRTDPDVLRTTTLDQKEVLLRLIPHLSRDDMEQ